MNSLCILALSCLVHVPVAAGFDVVGWYVGTNETSFPLESIQWEVYSTIRCGYVHTNATTGEASCSTDPFFRKCLAVALSHGKTVTLGPTDNSIGLEDYIYNATTDPVVKARGDRYIETLGSAVRSCGPGITGVEIDHEGDHTKLGRQGVVSKFEAHGYSMFLDRMQKSMGANYTVSADIGGWGLASWNGHGGDYPLGFTPWVDKEIFAANKNLFVNTMSYYWPSDCDITSFKKDGFVTHELWGIAKDQINIGIGYFSQNVTTSPRKIDPVISGEPGWGTLSKKCPGLKPDVCICDGVNFASKDMNFQIAKWVREEGYRGLFPWAANYDSPDRNESLAVWVGKGLGLIK